MKTEEERWRDAFEIMFCHTVIPRRSVDRIRSALADGRDPEMFLEDIEAGMEACAALMTEMNDRPPVCPHCLGTGVVLTTDSPQGGPDAQ